MPNPGYDDCNTFATRMHFLKQRLAQDAKEKNEIEGEGDEEPRWRPVGGQSFSSTELRRLADHLDEIAG